MALYVQITNQLLEKILQESIKQTLLLADIKNSLNEKNRIENQLKNPSPAEQRRDAQDGNK